MPAIPFIAAAGGLLAVDGYIKGEEASKQAREAAERGFQAQLRQQSEAKAQNAQAAAQERRSMVRQRRIAEARSKAIMENAGASDSSGELGLIGGLSTAFSANTATNLGAIASAERSSQYAQEGATAQFDVSQASSKQQSAQSQMNLGTSIFNMAGGFSSFTPSPKK